MKTLAIVLALSPLALPACAGKAPINVAVADGRGGVPDLSGVLRIASAGHRRGHACPVGPRVALSNAHLALTNREFSREGDFDDNPILYRWATRGDAHTGRMTGRVRLNGYDDVVAMESQTDFPRWYPISQNAPKPGDRLTFIGYDLRSRDNAWNERVFVVRLLRMSVGQLVYDRPGVHGASGSCVFNMAGEVVAIHHTTAEMESGEGVGGACGVWGQPVPEFAGAAKPSAVEPGAVLVTTR